MSTVYASPTSAVVPASTSVVMAAPTYAAAPATYASAPVTYAAAPVTYAAAPATYAAAPATYAAAPATYAAAPATYAAAPVTYSAAPATYAAAPVTYAASPMTYAGAPMMVPFAGVSGKLDKLKGAQLRAAFNAADRDGSGELDHNELAQIMQQCGIPGGDPATLKAKFAEFDADGSGKVSFAEFMATFHSKPPAPGPKNEGTLDGTGKYVDSSFPPNNDSVFRSPNPAADHVSDVQAHAGGNIEWKRCSDLAKGGRPVLFKSVHPNDIAQGVLGDCWFLAALAGLAEFEGAVFNLFQNKKLASDGKYTINIFNPASRTWDSVTIDDYVPCVNGEPIMAKPQDNEMWVLLLEKAFAKWFGSYCQIQGAYCMVAYMLLLDCGGPCKVFTQAMNGRAPFNSNMYTVVDAVLKEAKNRNSVGLNPKGQMSADQVWEELKNADASNHIMAAWTGKDPPGGAAGRGASGEAIANDGIVKGHAYSLISAKEVMRDDGQVQRCVQLRNPWGANPAAEYKGELADTWPGWTQYPRMKAELLGDGGKLDGMFWMTYENFRERYSDCGIVPKAMETFKMGQVAESSKTGHKHGRRAGAPAAAVPASASKPKKAKSKKSKGCCA